MWKETKARLGGLAAAVALAAVLGLAFTDMHGDSVSAQEGEPGGEMALQIGDCTTVCEVPFGETFTVSIVAPMVPEGGFTTFQTETFVGGMRYIPTACEEEVVIEPLEICLGPVVAPAGNVGHGGLTAIGASPPASTSFNLVDMPLSCPIEGTFGFRPDGVYEIAISTWPSSTQGSRFINASGAVAVRSTGTRNLEVVSPVDPDMIVTQELEIADAIIVNCVEQAPEPTPEGPDGEGPSPTPTAGVGDLPPTGGPGSLDADGGAGAALWAAIIALAVGAVAIGGVTIHRYYRGRRAA